MASVGRGVGRVVGIDGGRQVEVAEYDRRGIVESALFWGQAHM